MDLFEYAKSRTMENESPLASRLRPTKLEEVVGQQHIVGKDKLLYRAIKADKPLFFTVLQEPERPPWLKSLPILQAQTLPRSMPP